MEGRKQDSNQQFGTKERNKHSTRTTRRKKIKNNEDNIRTLWNISKHTNIQIIGVPGGEEEEQEIENLFEK